MLAGSWLWGDELDDQHDSDRVLVKEMPVSLPFLLYSRLTVLHILS